MGQQRFKTCSQNYIDLFSLAQGNADAHQECKSRGGFVSRFPEQGSADCGKRASVICPVFTG